MFPLALIVVLFISVLYKTQESLLLKGKKLKPEWHPTINYRYDEIYLHVAKGSLISHGVYFYSKKKAKGLVIYYHGNSGNMNTTQPQAQHFLKNGYDILLMDYRGFGKSEGKINDPKQLLEDSLDWFDWAKNNTHHKNIIVAGRSLGTGIATYVASQRQCSLLMLITPYDTLYDVAKSHYPWLPVKFIFKYFLPAIKWIDTLQQPVRIIHGTQDEVIFPERAKMYYELAKFMDKDIEIVWLDGGKHGNLNTYPEYYQWIKNSLALTQIKKNTDKI